MKKSISKQEASRIALARKHGIPVDDRGRLEFSYDQSCEDLAASFLVDYEHENFDAKLLAQKIQDAVEQFLEAAEEQETIRYLGTCRGVDVRPVSEEDCQRMWREMDEAQHPGAYESYMAEAADAVESRTGKRS